MSNDLLSIMETLAYIMGLIFTSLDNVYLGDYSILDIFLAFIFLDLILWFIFSVLGQKYRHDSEDTRKKGV